MELNSTIQKCNICDNNLMKKLPTLLFTFIYLLLGQVSFAQSGLNDKQVSVQLSGQRVYSGPLKARLTTLSLLYEYKPTHYVESGVQVFWPVVKRQSGSTERTVYQSSNLMLGYMVYINHLGKADFYVRGRTGVGGGSKTVLDSTDVIEVTRSTYIPVDIRVEAHYPVFPWLKVKGGIGGRLTTGLLSPQLSGATSTLGLMISLGHLKAAFTQGR